MRKLWFKANPSETDARPKQKFWFRAKTYGYGWYPATWQGWLVFIVYVGIILIASMTLDTNEPNVVKGAGLFLTIMVLATILMLGICYKTGEEAKWRWGDDENSNLKSQNSKKDEEHRK